MKIFLLCTVVIFSFFCNSIFIHINNKSSIGFSCYEKRESQLINNPDTIDPSDTICLNGLPPLGKWMFQGNKQRADWLGVEWRNKTLIEPVNIILIDSISSNPEQSEKLLIENLTEAGYTSRNLHSSGYLGYIGGIYYNQYPKENNHAFSNASAFVDNNHCRIFGPHFFNGAYFYTAALSRENVAPFSKVKHHFASFVRARDAFAYQLNKKSKFKIIKKVEMHNTIQNSAFESTGDHDGMALVLSLKK
jgi:hypothetical protein